MKAEDDLLDLILERHGGESGNFTGVPFQQGDTGQPSAVLCLSLQRKQAFGKWEHKRRRRWLRRNVRRMTAIEKRQTRLLLKRDWSFAPFSLAAHAFFVQSSFGQVAGPFRWDGESGTEGGEWYGIPSYGDD